MVRECKLVPRLRMADRGLRRDRSLAGAERGRDRLAVQARHARAHLADVSRAATSRRRRSACSPLAAFAPGGIYGFAAFPISLLWFATLACLWLLYRRPLACSRGRSRPSAVLAYPVGLVLIFVGAVWPFLARSPERPGARLRHAVTVAGLGAAAAFLVSLVQRVEVGSWQGVPARSGQVRRRVPAPDPTGRPRCLRALHRGAVVARSRRPVAEHAARDRDPGRRARRGISPA